MTIDVAVVDYGVGNLFSVRRGLEQCGANVAVSDDVDELLAAPRLVLPGVGAFSNGMSGLIERGLDQLVVEFARRGKPLLGICLGMQMLMSKSEEYGERQGLDLVPGEVTAIPPTTASEEPHKIPHIGWVSMTRPALLESWRGSILDGVGSKDSVYLVHSYAVSPDDDANRLADCDYNGRTITAAISRDNVHGTQFHPEKSGAVGLKILANFVRMSD